MTEHARFEFSFPAVRADLDAAVVMPKDTILVTQGEELKATCNALSSLQTDTTWFKVTYVHTVQHIYIKSNASRTFIL